MLVLLSLSPPSAEVPKVGITKPLSSAFTERLQLTDLSRSAAPAGLRAAPASVLPALRRAAFPTYGPPSALEGQQGELHPGFRIEQARAAPKLPIALSVQALPTAHDNVQPSPLVRRPTLPPVVRRFLSKNTRCDFRRNVVAELPQLLRCPGVLVEHRVDAEGVQLAGTEPIDSFANKSDEDRQLHLLIRRHNVACSPSLRLARHHFSVRRVTLTRLDRRQRAGRSCRTLAR